MPGCSQAVFVDPAKYVVNFRNTDCYESGSGREEYYFEEKALDYREVLLQFFENLREDMEPAY